MTLEHPHGVQRGRQTSNKDSVTLSSKKCKRKGVILMFKVCVFLFVHLSIGSEATELQLTVLS